MKNKSVWLLTGMLFISVLILGGYIQMDRMRTDKEAPEIMIDGAELSVSVQEAEEVLLQGVTAQDKEDGDVTESLIVENVYGITEDHCATVTYAAFDNSGNVAKAEMQIHYTDYQSPQFSLSSSLIFEFGSVFDVMEVIGANDVIDGDIKRLVKATMLSRGTSVTEEGTHDIQFRVTNSLGDTSQLILPVEVYPAGSYDAELELSSYMIYVPIGFEFNKESYLSKFSVLDQTIDLTSGIPIGLSVDMEGDVDTQIPGVHSVSYTATYTWNEKTYTGHSKLFVIVEG